MPSTFDLCGLGVRDFRLSPIPVAPRSFPAPPRRRKNKKWPFGHDDVCYETPQFSPRRLIGHPSEPVAIISRNRSAHICVDRSSVVGQAMLNRYAWTTSWPRWIATAASVNEVASMSSLVYATSFGYRVCRPATTVLIRLSWMFRSFLSKGGSPFLSSSRQS